MLIVGLGAALLAKHSLVTCCSKSKSISVHEGSAVQDLGPHFVKKTSKKNKIFKYHAYFLDPENEGHSTTASNRTVEKEPFLSYILLLRTPASVEGVSSKFKVC